MVRILLGLAKGAGTGPAAERATVPLQTSARSASDEAWIIDLCDAVLGQKALRQHRFPFLLGDPNRRGRKAHLPVDAFYPDLKLVIEYHECQHSKPVRFLDRRPTVSGVPRGQLETHL